MELPFNNTLMQERAYEYSLGYVDRLKNIIGHLDDERIKLGLEQLYHNRWGVNILTVALRDPVVATNHSFPIEEDGSSPELLDAVNDPKYVIKFEDTSNGPDELGIQMLKVINKLKPYEGLSLREYIRNQYAEKVKTEGLKFADLFDEVIMRIPTEVWDELADVLYAIEVFTHTNATILDIGDPLKPPAPWTHMVVNMLVRTFCPDMLDVPWYIVMLATRTIKPTTNIGLSSNIKTRFPCMMIAFDPTDIAASMKLCNYALDHKCGMSMCFTGTFKSDLQYYIDVMDPLIHRVGVKNEETRKGNAISLQIDTYDIGWVQLSELQDHFNVLTGNEVGLLVHGGTGPMVSIENLTDDPNLIPEEQVQSYMKNAQLETMAHEDMCKLKSKRWEIGVTSFYKDVADGKIRLHYFDRNEVNTWIAEKASAGIGMFVIDADAISRRNESVQESLTTMLRLSVNLCTEIASRINRAIPAFCAIASLSIHHFVPKDMKQTKIREHLTECALKIANYFDAGVAALHHTLDHSEDMKRHLDPSKKALNAAISLDGNSVLRVMTKGTGILPASDRFLAELYHKLSNRVYRSQWVQEAMGVNAATYDMPGILTAEVIKFENDRSKTCSAPSSGRVMKNNKAEIPATSHIYAPKHRHMLQGGDIVTYAPAIIASYFGMSQSFHEKVTLRDFCDMIDNVSCKKDVQPGQMARLFEFISFYSDVSPIELADTYNYMGINISDSISVIQRQPDGEKRDDVLDFYKYLISRSGPGCPTIQYYADINQNGHEASVSRRR